MAYDILGNIAIIKPESFGKKRTKKKKINQANELLKKPGVRTVLEQASNVKGRLRTIKTKHVKGVKNLIAEYKENNCVFKFNVENCYFSPRLSNERKLIAGKIKSSDKVLVMFAGVGVYPIVIYKNSRPEKIIGIEIGRDCCRWFKENLKLNKIPDNRVEAIQGDVKKKIKKEFSKKYGKFDIVVMPRPNLKETFLEQGLFVSKKGTKIFYYGFSKDDEVNNLIKEINKEVKKLKRKIKIEKIVAAGDIAPFKHRYRIEINVLK